MLDDNKIMPCGYQKEITTKIHFFFCLSKHKLIEKNIVYFKLNEKLILLTVKSKYVELHNCGNRVFVEIS